MKEAKRLRKQIWKPRSSIQKQRKRNMEVEESSLRVKKLSNTGFRGYLIEGDEIYFSDKDQYLKIFGPDELKFETITIN